MRRGPKILCDRAKIRDGYVMCQVNGEYCGHQIYRRCKGWWEQSPEAAFCKYGKDDKDGTEVHPD